MPVGVGNKIRERKNPNDEKELQTKKVSRMQANHSGVIAILCSDIHLSLKPPVARSVEGDWFHAMKRQLDELKVLQKTFNCPIICAGDIFDDGWRPNRCPPQLINFAIENLPFMYAVPGQHDLPYHRLDYIKQSAYWTLVEAGKIKNLEYQLPVEVPIPSIGLTLDLYGFPWGTKIRPIEDKTTFVDYLHLAIVHSYIWNSDKTKYFGASKDQHISKYKNPLKGYDAAVFGDNHKGFIQNKGKGLPHIINCGTFFRRKIDEKDYSPCVGLLYPDGRISPQPLDVIKDKFIEVEDLQAELESKMDMDSLMDTLKDVGDAVIDFKEAIFWALKKEKPFPEIKKLILDCMEEKL